MAKKKEQDYIYIGKEKIKKTSELGKVLEKSAKSKKQSTKKFIAENLEQVKKLKENYRETRNKAVDDVYKVIQEKPSNAKVFLNDKKVSSVKAIFALEEFGNKLRRKDKTVMQILMDYQMNLKGDIFLKLPEIRRRKTDEDIEDYLEELEDYLEEEDITLIISDKKKK